MIKKIEFSARNLSSNAGFFYCLNTPGEMGSSTLSIMIWSLRHKRPKKIKMNHSKTMLCGNFIGIDKLDRLKLLQSDPLVNEYAISIKEPETVARFLGNFRYKTTQRLREINFNSSESS